eukprot:2698315-Karenia_brevis.AAC.1
MSGKRMLSGALVKSSVQTGGNNVRLTSGKLKNISNITQSSLAGIESIRAASSAATSSSQASGVANRRMKALQVAEILRGYKHGSYDRLCRYMHGQLLKHEGLNSLCMIESKEMLAGWNTRNPSFMRRGVPEEVAHLIGQWLLDH